MAAFLVTGILSLILQTNIPIVAVISGSMDHGLNEAGYPCRNNIGGNSNNFDIWWSKCESTYREFGITKEQFIKFPFSNGFKKGDIAFLQNSNKIAVGDIIVYDAKNQNIPIIHRIVKIENGIYMTKGDHNPIQNSYENDIQNSQIRGKSIFIIPYLGYLRLLLPI